MVATRSNVVVNCELVIAGKTEWFGITRRAEEAVLGQVLRSTRAALI